MLVPRSRAEASSAHLTRFDDDGPARKRARVRISKACIECRKRKEKCDGAQPRCNTCIRTARICAYDEGRKRGLRTGYVRSLELVLGLLVLSRPGAEDYITSALAPKLPQPTYEAADGSDDSDLSLLKTWRDSRASQSLQNFLSSFEASEDDERCLQSLEETLKASKHDIQNDTQSYAGDITVTSDEPTTASQVVPSSGHGTDIAVGHQLLPENAGTVPQLPPDWHSLLDEYVARVHCWLPAVEKFSLFRTANLLSGASESHSNSRCPTSGESASLFAALALGMQSATLVKAHGAYEGCQTISSLAHIAARLTTQAESPCEPGHVHAALLLAMLSVGGQAWDMAWIWTGRAAYVSTLLRRNHTTPRSSSADTFSRRLFRSCFVVDTIISAQLGYRPYFTAKDMASVDAVDVESMEEWESWQPAQTSHGHPAKAAGPSMILSTFNTFCDLMALLNASLQADDTPEVRLDYERLLYEYSRLEARSPSLGTSEPVSPVPLNVSAPHIAHLRVAAAAVYGVLSTRAQARTDHAGNYFLRPAKGIINVLQLLQDPAARVALDHSTDMPSTTSVFLNIYDRTTYATNNETRKQISSTSSTHQGVGLSMGAFGDPNLDIDRSATLDVMSTNRTSQYNLPTNTAFTSPPDALREVSNTQGLMQETMSEVPGQTTSSIGFPPLQQTLSRSSVQTFQNGMESIHNMSADEYRTLPPPVTSNRDDDLFGQLSLLDNADWPLGGDEFMAHLGLTHGGNVLDFDTLFAP